MLIVTLIILVTATPLFEAPPPSAWGWFLLVTLCTVAAFTGLGVLIGVVSANSRATLLWSQLIFLPSMLISGLMMPLAILPPSAQTLARLLPTTYAMNAYNGLAFGLAILLFNWDRQNRTARLHPAFGLLAMLPYVAGAVLL
jgi:ABC-2 type transport system permease protein